MKNKFGKFAQHPGYCDKDTHSLTDYGLMECVEAGLGQFGLSVEHFVLWRMYSLGEAPKEGILVNPEAFVAALKRIFGYSARFVEETILDVIKVRCGKEYSEIDNFADLVKAIRRATMTLMEALT